MYNIFYIIIRVCSVRHNREKKYVRENRKATSVLNVELNLLTDRLKRRGELATIMMVIFSQDNNIINFA